jgi:hypothetical protein
MNTYYRWARVVFLFAALLLGMQEIMNAQNMIVQPTKKRNSVGEFEPTLLNKADRTIRIDWGTPQGQPLDLTGRNATLKIGSLRGNYSTMSIPVTGNRLDFVANTRNLAPGRYYARVTNAPGNTITQILDAFGADSQNILYSNEIQIIVEAPTAAFVISPRGDITNATPTFSWEPVPGVVAYWIIMSSTPFQIEDDNGEIKITGVTGVWQYMTTQTTATYGQIVDAFPDEPPPLNDGQEYSFTILNLYEEANPVFVSPVFGGIIPFRFRNPNALPVPQLVAPINEQVFINSPQITFSWNEVAGATNYTVRLSKRLTQSGAEVSLPVWTTTTTNTLIDVNAVGLLENTRYVWNVIANDEFGRGTTSQQRNFRYQIDTGRFDIAARNATDGSVITGVDVRAVAISGGSTSALSYILQGGSVGDSLVAGTYEFTGTKSGFQDATTVGTIRANDVTYMVLNMEPMPSGISGTVVDNLGQPVQNSQIQTTDLVSGERFTTVTNVTGGFSQSLQPGTYTVQATRAGYISSTARTYLLELGQQVNEANNFVIQNDLATISGFVFNQAGNPIQLARVTATRGESQVEALTDGQGFYSVNVSSGSWSLRAGKTGFVSPAPSSVSLSVGDNIQNQNFNLPAGANQVSGTIRRLVTNDDGTTGLAPFAGVVVTAVPSAGNPVSATTGNSGQYSLSLTAGTYEMVLSRAGFTQAGSSQLTLRITETVSGVDFEMRPNPSAITGRVTTTSGAGLSGATVSIPNLGSATTTAAGNYSISVPEGTHELSAVLAGYVSPRPQTVSVSPGQTLSNIDFSMSANAGVIGGLITSGGQTLTGVSVRSVSLTTGTVSTVSSNSEGRYSLSLLAGRYTVQASRSGYLSSRIDTVSIGPGQQVTNVDFVLTENVATIRGVVTSGGAPMRNVRVNLVQDDNTAFTQTTQTLVNGSYSFVVPAGRVYRLQTVFTGYSTANFTTAQLAPSVVVSADLAITPNPASIAGRTRTAAGANLRDVRVVVIETSSGVRRDSVTTGSDGTFNIGLQPGTYTIRAQRPGYSVENTPITVEIGQNLTGIDFALRENFALLQGIARDGDGNPIDNVFVNLLSQQGQGGTTSTDQNGGYSISRLIGGTYTLSFSKTGYIGQSRTISITDGTFTDQNVVLQAATGSIAGVITDAVSGSPVDDADIIVRGDAGVDFQTTTDDSGRYSVSNLPPANYEIVVSRTGFAAPDPLQVVLTPENLLVTDADIDQLIPNNAVISGVVRNAAGLSPLLGVQVNVSGPAGAGSARTSNTGEFTIDNLGPGAYTVTTQLSNFSSVTQNVELVASQQASLTFDKLRDNGRITGRVTDQQGQILTVIPEVVISSDRNQYRVRAGADGRFEVTGVPTGIVYTMSTALFRNGYVNANTSVTYPLGQETVEQDLVIRIDEGRISGTTGVAETTVRLSNITTGETVSTILSNANGEFAFSFLPQGNYRLNFSRAGFVYTPAQSPDIVLGFRQSVVSSTTAQPNVGVIVVNTRLGAGTALSGVTVRVISSDATIQRTVTSNAQGEARFADMPAGVNYIISLSRTGFSADPASRDFTLPVGTTQIQNFTMIPSDARITGRTLRIQNGTTSNLGEVGVRVRNTASGLTRQVTSTWEGIYDLPNLPSGNYELIGSRDGFLADTLLVTVDPGQTRSDVNLEMESSVFSMFGRISFRGVGVANQQVSLTSTSTVTRNTDSDGFVYFNDLPIRPGANDTTVYQVRYETSGNVFNRTVRVTRENLGQFLSFSEIILPSGQVVANVSDGVAPLAGVNISFTRVGGSATTAITTATGEFRSAGTLRASQYQLNYSRIGYLSPSLPLAITLPSDTVLVQVAARLPYRHEALTEIRADRPASVQVLFPAAYDASSAQARLFYRLASQSTFIQVPMTRTEGVFSAEIPALFSEDDIVYYASVSDAGVTYRTADITRKPLASGILSTIRFTPQVNQQILRAGDTYTLRLDIADGINESLNSVFAAGGEGEILWTLPDGITVNSTVGTTITFTPTATGSANLRVTLRYKGVERTGLQAVTVVSDPITGIRASTSVTRILNTAPLLFSYVATDAQGRRQLLGSGLSWSLEPAEAGTISPEGVFRAVANDYIGAIRVTVTDDRTGISEQSEPILVFAEVRRDRSYTFSDRQGMRLIVPQEAVTATSQISVRTVPPEDVKKYVFLENTTDSYITSDRIYRFNLSTGAFTTGVQLELPIDDSHDFNAGDKVIGLFDRSNLVWSPFSTLNKGTSVEASGITQMGQFSVLAQSEPLDIRHLSVLPSPFSPDVAPLRIGYLLTTQAPPALVTIQIYNIRGELVRTILKDDLQQQGRYGSRAGIKEITWDGLTDDGLMARNGRYIIRVRAKDAEGERTGTIPVVLVK